MNNYERLTHELTQSGLRVDESILRGKPVHGLYLSTPEVPPTALINGDLTASEKRCILAEEAGHHYRSAGTILDQFTPQARKAENAGRRWAWEKLLPLEAIALKKFSDPDLTLEDMAAALDVTVPFLVDAVEHYRRTSGARTELLCGLTVQFEPYFYVWITDEPHEEYAFFTRCGRRLSPSPAARLAILARKLFERLAPQQNQSPFNK